ncbi:MAG: hypothetical protein IPL79_15215 [Myxococcales bacterium]|nr:hypothetical protein [Myxococcales bacterium]
MPRDFAIASTTDVKPIIELIGVHVAELAAHAPELPTLFLPEFAIVLREAGDISSAPSILRGHARAAQLVADDEISGDLFGGTVGAGWLLAHLEQHAPSPSASVATSLERLDQLLLESVAEVDLADPPLLGHWDGVAGWLAYAIKRPQPRLIDAICALLRRLATPGEAPLAIYWAERNPVFGTAVETGLGHGVAALLSGLAQLPRHDQAQALLAEATRWLIGRIRDDGTAALSWVEVPHDASARIKTDAGWAHGDAGVALALYAAATALGEPAWQARAIDVAVRSTRRPMEDYIQPPSVTISHGAAGLMHIYQQLYRATDLEVFRAAAVRWCEWCCRAYADAAPALPPPHNIEWGRTLVGGHLGVAAVLASACRSDAPSWTGYLATTLPPTDPLL